MRKVFVDLEMCPIPKEYAAEKETCKLETIEIGAVMLDEEGIEIASFKEYIKPAYATEIPRNIEKLTGIHYGMVQGAGTFREVLQRFTDWCGEMDYIIFSWSDNDLLQILQETALKDIQKTDTPQERILAEYEALASRLMTKAETFIRDFEEVENNTISLEEMKKDYGDWIRVVKESFFKLSDTDPAPVERIRWAEAILDLAGWVTDMVLFLERDEAGDKPGETWMVKQAISRYRQSMDELRRIVAVMVQ